MPRVLEVPCRSVATLPKPLKECLLRLIAGSEDVKFLTPEMMSKPGVKVALHKVVNQLSMVSYFDYRDAGLYLEKADLLPSKKGEPENNEDDMQNERLVDHLPLASFHCSPPAMTSFEYADEYGPFGWKLKKV